MADGSERIVDVSITLATSFPTLPSFSTKMCLMDSVDIPRDQIFRSVTEPGVSDLTSGNQSRDFAQMFYAQKRKAPELVLGRWVSADLAPLWIAGTHEADITIWEAIADGSYNVADSGANDEDVSGHVFTGITTLAQAIVIMNARLAALVAPTVVGLDTATWALDKLGRLVLTMPTAGATEPTITVTITAPLVGTDISVPLLDSANGSAETGYDAESLIAAHDRIKVVKNYYDISQRGGTDDQIMALAAQVNGEVYQFTAIEPSVDAYDILVTTDLASRGSLASLDRFTAVYTSQTDDPDAAIDGAVLPALEGSTNFGFEKLANVIPSGTVGTDKNLTTTQRANLVTKKYTFVEKSADDTYAFQGLTVTGKEKRLILGSDWLAAGIQASMFSAQITEALMGFDDTTLGVIDSILTEWLDEAVKRRIVTTYTITLPQAEDFTAALKATHKMTLLEVFRGEVVTSVSTYQITGTLSI